MSSRPARKIRLGVDAREALASGVDLVARTVAPTFGPRGRVVVLDSRFGTPELSPSYIDRKMDSPLLADDGHAVAQEILIADTFVNQGILLARDAGRAIKLGMGDGSTTAILLTQALVRGGVKAIASGAHPRAVERGMDAAIEQALERLRAAAVAVSGREQLTRVAASAAGGDDEIAGLVTRALGEVGGGHVAFEPSRRAESSLDVTSDYAIDRGLVSPQFVTDQESRQAVLHDAYILIVDSKIERGRDLVPALDLAAAARRPLLVIAEEFGADALALLTVNVINHKVVAAPVPSPGYGEGRRETFADIAALTGATVVGGEGQRALAAVTESELGQAQRVIAAKSLTRIAGGRGDADVLAVRVAGLAQLAAEADNVHDRDEAENRRARLDGKGVATVLIGGMTDTEVRGRTRAAQDALAAARSATDEGILPGGATSLVRAAQELASVDAAVGERHDDARIGFEVVRHALAAPLRALASTAGLAPGPVVQAVMGAPPGHGYDLDSGEVRDLLEAGIVDSAGVVCAALESAAYVAKRLVSTEVLIVQPIYAGKYAGTAAEGGPANLTMR